MICNVKVFFQFGSFKFTFLQLFFYQGSKQILLNKMAEKQSVKIIQLIDKDTGKKQPYVLQLKLLGKGFYGSVFKAVHKYNPNKVFAVKVIKLQNQESKQEILKELQIIQQIPRSPNLVDTHKQHLESERHLYIFQQYCDGGSLAQLRQRNSGRLMKQSQIYDLFYQLGRGFLDLHRAGIIHEDIKPSNILIKGRLYKYCDFGVSQLVSQLKHSVSRKGTVSYMPLQKLLAKFLPNAKSDIYSLGITLYEVIFGFHPYLQKKTNNTKEYVNALKKAQLRPSHQLLRRVSNPSIMFNNFLNILEGMIALRVQLRVGVQELQDILMNHQLFKNMKIPTQEQSPKLKNNPYSNSQDYNIVAQSKIVFTSSPNKSENKLVNEDFQINLLESSELNTREQAMRLSRVKEQEQSRMYLNLKTEHRLLQAVVNHLSNGLGVLKRTFQDIQTQPLCGDTFFQREQFSSLPNPRQEKACHMFNCMILKFNILLITNFRQSVQNFQKFYQQVQLSEQIQYLQAQFSKFITDENIENRQIKRWLVNVTRDWTVERFCSVLTRQFQKMFKCIVYQNSVRINFKGDILNGLWLLHINQVIKSVIKLAGIGSSREGLPGTSQTTQSQEIRKLDGIIKNHNIYKTLRIQQLKEQFYKEFQSIEGVFYDMQQNSGEWISLSDMVEEEQEERVRGQIQEFQEVEFNQVETIKKEEFKAKV